MTRRRSPWCWLGHLSVATLMTLVAIALPLSARAGVADVTVPGERALQAEPDPVALVASTEDALTVGPAPEAADVAPAEPTPVPDPCADALAWVATAGLPLPDGVDYHCPSAQFPHQGAACWGNPTFCPDRGFIAINMDRLEGTTTEYLRHVVAHEVCHILDFQARGRSTEWGADACAAAHGAGA